MVSALNVEKRDAKLVVRFTRPEIRNPISVSVLDDLTALMDSIASDRVLKKVVFTGTGNVFASGADLREIAELTPSEAAEFATRGQDLMNRIAKLPQMTVAAINGYCFGGALDLALACNMRIASPNAIFSHPGVGLGIITGWGGTQRLPRLIGEVAAKEIFFTAGRFDADWAFRVGLVDEISEDPLGNALADAPVQKRI